MSTKIKELENKISNVTDLVKQTNYEAKISNFEEKYFTASDYNKFTRDIIDAKIKQTELVNKFDMSSLLKYYELNTKLVILATKTELKAKVEVNGF